MKNIEVINTLRVSTFTDGDGEEYGLDFQDGLTNSEIDELAKLYPTNRIDNELKAILKETRGWEGYGPEGIDFSSIGQFGFYELSPKSITLGHDGFGNSWILDILDNGALGQVYYASHDPAVFVKYSDTLNGFLNCLLEFNRSPSENYLNEIHDKVVFDIWSNGGLIFEKTLFRTITGNLKNFSPSSKVING